MNVLVFFIFLSNPAVLLSRGSVKHIQGDWVISTQPILRKWRQRHHRILLKQLHHRICCLLWLAALNSLFVGHSGFFLSYKPAICQQAPHSTDQSLALSLTELCHRHGQQHVDFFFCRKRLRLEKINSKMWSLRMPFLTDLSARVKAENREHTAQNTSQQIHEKRKKMGSSQRQPLHPLLLIILWLHRGCLDLHKWFNTWISVVNLPNCIKTSRE